MPSIVAVPSLFFSVKSLMVIWKSYKKTRHTNKSLVFESMGNYPATPNFHLPFSPSSAGTPAMDTSMMKGGRMQVRVDVIKEDISDVSSTSHAFGGSEAESRGGGREKLERHEIIKRDQSTAWGGNNASEVVWIHPQEKSDIEGGGQISGIETQQKTSRLVEMRDGDMLGDVSGGGMTPGRYTAPIEFNSQLSEFIILPRD